MHKTTPFLFDRLAWCGSGRAVFCLKTKTVMWLRRGPWSWVHARPPANVANKICIRTLLRPRRAGGSMA